MNKQRLLKGIQIEVRLWWRRLGQWRWRSHWIVERKLEDIAVATPLEEDADPAADANRGIRSRWVIKPWWRRWRLTALVGIPKVEADVELRTACLRLLDRAAVVSQVRAECVDDDARIRPPETNRLSIVRVNGDGRKQVEWDFIERRGPVFVRLAEALHCNRDPGAIKLSAAPLCGLKHFLGRRQKRHR